MVLKIPQKNWIETRRIASDIDRKLSGAVEDQDTSQIKTQESMDKLALNEFIISKN